MSWDLSCPDWVSRLSSGRSLVPTLPIDQREGDRAVAIFNRLRLADVPRTPTMEEAAGDWFRDIVRALFGSLDPVTRARHIRELFLLIPKKNSKTTNGALLMLTALLLNQRPNASLIMTAPVQDVAQLAFDAAAGAIELDDVLKRKLHVREHLKTIEHRETHAELRIMTFDPKTLTGQKPVAVLIDELHVVAKMANAASALRQLRGGMLPYPEAFMAFITTQAEESPAGVFRAELMKARAIRDGRQEGVMLPVLYEFPQEMQRNRDAWRDPANWPMVTPNAGRSISIARLVEEAKTAEQTSADEFLAWASQHLNVEIGLALRSDGWAGAEFWERNSMPGLTLDHVIEFSEVVTTGIDGGGLDDLLGFGAVGRVGEARRVTVGGAEYQLKPGDWLHWAHAWAHPSVLERRKSEAPRLLDLAAGGHLTLSEHIGDDVADVADLVLRIEASGKLADKGIGVDPVGIGSIHDALIEGGLDPARIVGVSQGWRLAGAIKTTERRLAEGTLRHGGSPLMDWCIGNAKIEPRANSILITKASSGTAKIDPLMALLNAVSLMALNPEPASGEAFYNLNTAA